MVSLVFINTKHLQIKSDKKSCDCKICNLLDELKDTKITKKKKQSTNKNCIHNLTTYQLQENVTHLGNLKQFTLPFLCMFEFLLLNHFQKKGSEYKNSKYVSIYTSNCFFKYIYRVYGIKFNRSLQKQVPLL